jgi:hypothetical protein
LMGHHGTWRLEPDKYMEGTTRFDGLFGTTCHSGCSERWEDFENDTYFFKCSDCGAETRHFKKRYFDADGDEI